MTDKYRYYLPVDRPIQMVPKQFDPDKERRERNAWTLWKHALGDHVGIDQALRRELGGSRLARVAAIVGPARVSPNRLGIFVGVRYPYPYKGCSCGLESAIGISSHEIVTNHRVHNLQAVFSAKIAILAMTLLEEYRGHFRTHRKPPETTEHVEHPEQEQRNPCA